MAPSGAARAVEPPRLAVLQVEEAPALDGVLDDPQWVDAQRSDAFLQVEPDEGDTPSQRTEIMVVSDGDALYVGVRCYDREPGRIVAQQLSRDSVLVGDDQLRVIIDGYADRRTGFLFEVNPLGARADALVDNQQVVREWDGIWNARARIDAEGWSVEFEIPFKTLSFDPKRDSWGFNVERVVRRRGEVIRWASIDRNLGFVNLVDAGWLEGLSGSQQGIGLDIVPASTLRYVNDPTQPEPDGDPRSYVRWDPSLDVFYKPTPRVTGVVTVNTDFGETEVDGRQINLTRFPLFFPEKRDFFLQDSGLFDFGGLTGGANGRPFFSRRIGLDSRGEPIGILAGAKLTGRVNRLNFGLLDVQTESYDDIDSKNLAVGRASVNVLEESNVGLIGTYGDPLTNGKNGLFGFDGLYRNSHFRGGRSVVGRVWYQHTETSNVDSDQSAWGARLEYPNDRWNWQMGALGIGRNFRPALGRVSRRGIREYDASLRRRWRPRGAIRIVETRVNGVLLTNLDNRVDTSVLTWRALGIENRPGDSLVVRYRHQFERLMGDFAIRPGIVIPAGGYHFDQAAIGLSSAGGRRWGIDIEVGGGSFFDGTRADIVSSLLLRPTPHVTLSLSYSQTQAWLAQGSFATRITGGRLSLRFSPDLTWSTLVQWDSSSDRLGIQSRIEWIIVPGRELIVVLNQDVEALSRSPVRGRTEPLAKLLWTFRF